jgi:hypothetical protein
VNDHARDLLDFLANMGIQAEVRLDSSDNPLVVMATTEFHRRRNLVETWFRLVDEGADYSCFYERPRGTEDSI